MSALLLSHHRRIDLESETFVPAVTPCLPAYGGPRGTTNNPQFDDHAVVVGALTGHKERGGWRAGPDEAAAGHVIAYRKARKAHHADDGERWEEADGRGTPLVAVAEPLDASYAKTTDSAGSNGAGPRNVVIARPLRANRWGGSDSHGDEGNVVASTMSVRRLTPVECERLQGFPHGWTDGLSDSARYRCLGNAVCVPVVEWIGRRIAEQSA